MSTININLFADYTCQMPKTSWLGSSTRAINEGHIVGVRA